MNSDTIYKEGNHDDFITYLFSDSPKEKGEVKLELPLNEPGKNVYLHEFEQLLMIFVDGLKYFHGDNNNKVNVDDLSLEDFNKMNQYFKSMNYEIKLEIFENMYEYKFKFPNYFKNQETITNETKLEDFYYEIFNSVNKVFRISFKYL